MRRTLSSVADVMTPGPHSVSVNEPLLRAMSLMRDLRIRHLPVMRKGKLVGIVSDRDANLVTSLADAPAAEVTVEDAMTTNPYAVSPDTPLDEVAREMAERKIGSAVVMDGSTVIGVFTTTDALRALAECLGASAPALRKRAKNNP